MKEDESDRALAERLWESTLENRNIDRLIVFAGIDAVADHA